MTDLTGKSGGTVLFLLPKSSIGWPEELSLYKPAEKFRPVLVDYDHEVPDEAITEWGGDPPLGPMDLLGEQDVASIYDEVFSWRRRVGQAVTEPNVRDAAAVWLVRLTQTGIMFLRIIRLVRATVRHVGPTQYAVVGEHPTFPWVGTLVHRTLGQLGLPAVPAQKEASERASRIEVDWLPDNLKQMVDRQVDVSGERNQQGAGLEEALETFANVQRKFLSGRPNIVVPMRFRSAAAWFQDRVTGRLLRADAYNELYMERLAGLCSERGWAMTLISYDGPGNVPEGGCPLSDLYPGTVRELSRSDLPNGLWERDSACAGIEEGRIAAALSRPEVRAALHLDEIPVADVLAPLVLEDMVAAYVRYSALEGAQWGRAMEVLQPTMIAGARLEAMPHFLRAGQRLRVPTVSLRFGIGNEMLLGSLTEDPVFGENLHPTLNLAWGAGPARILRRQGKFVRARGPGRPRHDVFVLESRYVDVADVRQRIGVPPRDHIVLVGINCRTRFAEEVRGRGQGIVSPATLAECIDALAQIAERVGRTRIVMKPHGSDDMDLLRQIIAAKGRGLAMVATNKEEGFHNVEILAASSLLVANPSSMLAEGVCTGVPGILLATPDVRLFFEHNRIKSCAEFACQANTIDELAVLAKRLLIDHGFRRKELARARIGVARHFGKPDGRIAERVARTIADTAHDHLHGCPWWRTPFRWLRAT